MRTRLYQTGVTYAYALAAAGVLAATSLVGYGVVNSMTQPTAAVLNESTTTSAMSTAALALGKMVATDTDSWPLPMAGSVANGDGYDVPPQSGAPLVDGWTGKFRYCPWDHGTNTNAGRIAGDRYPTGSSYLFAILSAGPDKVFATTCANLKAGALNGDDLATWRLMSEFKKDGVGNTSLLESVDCESATSPTTDLLGAAANCGTSSSRLDLIDTTVVKEGQQTVVRKSAKVMAWQGGAWRQIVAGAGNYPAPMNLNFTDLVDQTCGSTVTSAATQVNGIAIGTPITISGGSYATSTDNVTYSAWSTSVSTINPGTWIKLRATTSSSTDFATTSVVVNIGGTEKIWNASNGVCKCVLPWGGTINNGQSTTAYASTSVPYGNVCASETRSCTGTTLSGSYQYGSCTVQAGATCSLPWGGSISHGQSTTAYASSSVPYGSSCTSQSRTCDNGSLSGTYTNQTCTVQSPSSCNLPWGGTIAHGGSTTAYASSSVPYGSSCTSQTRTCNNGSLSGSYSYQSCYVESAAASCSLPWGGTIPHGSSATAYNAYSVPYGSSCYSESRYCNNGSLSGSYSASSCSVSSPASCTSPWGGSVPHGGSITAYQSGSVNSPATCVSEGRTCNNGSLSGSYTNQNCTVVQSGVWSGAVKTGWYCSASMPGTSGFAKSGSCSPKGSTNGYSQRNYDVASCGAASPWYASLWEQYCQ